MRRSLAMWRAAVIPLVLGVAPGIPAAVVHAAPPDYAPAAGSPYGTMAGVDVPIRAFAEDADADGDRDVVVLGARGAIDLLLNDGAGGFARRTGLVAPYGRNINIDAKDVNGDGRVDFVLGTYDGGDNPNRLGDTPRVVLSAPGATYATRDLPGDMTSYGTVFVDGDADGDQDVVAHADAGSVGMRLWRNDGTGTFGGSVVLDALAANDQLLSRGDLDADGDEDFVAAPHDGHLLRVYRNGPGGLQFDGEIPSGRPVNLPFAIVDLDGDGRTDLVWNAGPSFVTVRFGAAGGGLEPARDLWPDAGAFLGRVDFEGDGRREVAFAIPDGSVMFGSLVGRTPGPLSPAPGGEPASHVLTPDLNADGRPDLVLVRPVSGQVDIRFALPPPVPPGPPDPVPPPGPTPPPECADRVDQDRDGLVDAADPQCRAGRGVEGPADDPLLACTGRELVLLDVLRRGKRVLLRGLADPRHSGRTVSLHADGRRIGSATVTRQGTFRATVRAPRRARTRFQARLGAYRTLNLKLKRRTIDATARRSGSRVVLSGRVTTGRRRARVELLQRIGCGAYRRVATGRLRSGGRFTVRARRPADLDLAVFRVRVVLRSGVTFSLPRTVRLK